MCGIAGIIATPGRVKSSRMLAMRDSLAHRGPDDAGTWVSRDGIAMLSSRRLAILDRSPDGHQPMIDAERGLVITFNGEIYNYVELARELAQSGFRFHSRSDTEVLLKSYAKWGDECLEHLNGMFAFVIWDMHRRELFAARDRFGEKPFYFYLDDNRELFAFASEIKALVAARIFPLAANPPVVCDFLKNRGLDAGAETIFEHVSSLPAAHALRYSWSSHAFRTWRYWDLYEGRNIRFPEERKYDRRFLELFSDSVLLRLRSDVPVGSSLSGGIDSSAIVGLVAKRRPEAGQASFSARFVDSVFDEGVHIEKMTAWTQVENYSTYPNPDKLPDEFDKLAWHQDEPFGGSSIYAQWCVMRLARDHGVTVLLDGQGGDEVLAGYHSFFSDYLLGLLQKGRFFKASNILRQYLSVHGAAQLPLILLGLLPPGLRASTKFGLKPLAIAKEFEHNANRPVVSPRKKFRHPLHQSLYESLTSHSLPKLLRFADRNSMAFSREVRLPFLDHRLVEYVFAIPPEQKLNRATTKVVLRNAISGIVPEEIRRRKDKLGYAPPEVAWLRGPMRPWAEDTFRSASFRQREWVDVRAIESLWNRFLDGDGGLHRQIWRWLSLEAWARNCLVSGRAEPSTSAIKAGDNVHSAYAN